MAAYLIIRFIYVATRSTVIFITTPKENLEEMLPQYYIMYEANSNISYTSACSPPCLVTGLIFTTTFIMGAGKG